MAAVHRPRRPARPRAGEVRRRRAPISCADIAYHRGKFERGWEHLIDIWGADHHGQVKSLQVGDGGPRLSGGRARGAARAAREARARWRAGALSKRAGNIITLADILDEVDPDVARLTFLLQSIDTQQTFDLDLVTSQSMENPVYYVQYAHARIASIGRRAAERGITRLPILDADLAPLTHDRELELLRALAAYPDVVAEAAALRAPHRITTWVRDFAKEFHGFYRDCRVISDDIPLTQARLWLAEACRLGLAERARDPRRARARRDAPAVRDDDSGDELDANGENDA